MLPLNYQYSCSETLFNMVGASVGASVGAYNMWSKSVTGCTASVMAKIVNKLCCDKCSTFLLSFIYLFISLT